MYKMLCYGAWSVCCCGPSIQCPIGQSWPDPLRRPNISTYLWKSIKYHVITKCLSCRKHFLVMLHIVAADMRLTETLPTTYQHPTNTLQTPYRNPTNTMPTPYQHPTDRLQILYRHPTDTLPTPYQHPTNTLPAPYQHPHYTIPMIFSFHISFNLLPKISY